MSTHKPKHSKNSPYWLYGTHAVSAALVNPARQISRLLATRQVAEKLPQGTIKPEICEARAIEKHLPKDAVHQGVAALVQPLAGADLEDVVDLSKPLLALDQVTDPHNIGAILRSAAAFDIGAIIVTHDHAPGESAVMAKSASGALEIVPLVVVTNLAQTIKEVKKHGYWVAGLDGEAPKTLAEANLDAQTLLVLGAEGKGLRRLTGELCDFLVKLPMSEQMESLNVSNAAAIACYELFKSRA